MANSKIEWTDKVWNPSTGCTKVSAGCKNCYAEVIAKRFWKERKFTDVICHEDRLTQPLHWKKPAKIFVNSMSDLFHEKVPFAFIDSVYEVMGFSTQHIFQILTKRPERALEYYNWTNIFKAWSKWEHIWLGVSVENQQTADERIPLLLQAPAAVRFLSAEPLLGKIIIPKISYRKIGQICSSCSGNGYYSDNFKTTCPDCKGSGKNPTGLNWIICGGESGTNARPMHPDWVLSLRDQCKESHVPFFMKQICDVKGRKLSFESIPEDLQIREFPHVG